MSGFALLTQPGIAAPAQRSAFANLVQLVAEFKGLNDYTTIFSGERFAAAKLDSPSSLHRGITRDERTGSWLLAVGTVVYLGTANSSDSSLQRLLTQFLERGANALQDYDGHFGLVIYDERARSISIVSDPMGQFSVFWRELENKILISTSALALARYAQVAPDILTIESFLRTGRLYADKTFWKGIRRLAPATILQVTGEGVEEIQYWSPTVREAVAKLSFDKALDQAMNMLTAIFGRTLAREGLVWADLTGGFDSRLTTMLMDRVGTPFVTYCAGPADHPDVQIARLISGELGWEFQHIALPDNWDQEQFSWAETALHRSDGQLDVFQLARVLWGHQKRANLSTVHVTGVGADEWREPPCWRTDLHSLGKSALNLDYFIDSMVFKPVPTSVLRQDRTEAVREELRIHFSRLISSYSAYPKTLQQYLLWIRHRYPTHGGSYLSAESGIARAISPFTFKELVNFGFSLKYRWHLNYHYRFTRELLLRGNPRLANIQTAKGGPAAPMRLANLFQFWPLLRPIINRGVKKLSGRLLGIPLEILPSSHYTQYPLPIWLHTRRDVALSRGWLDPSKMYSSGLYNGDSLRSLLSQPESPRFPHQEFLDRVITVEMNMRASGMRADTDD